MNKQRFVFNPFTKGQKLRDTMTGEIYTLTVRDSGQKYLSLYDEHNDRVTVERYRLRSIDERS